MVFMAFACVACQGFLFGIQQDPTDHWGFYEKLYQEVPKIKDLLLDAGVQTYLQNQPYIYGGSDDGRYLSVLTYIKEKQVFRMDFYQLDSGRCVQTLYLPEKSKLETKMHSKDGDEMVEYLEIVQETIDKGYRINKPVKPVLLVTGNRYILQKEAGWYARAYKQEGDLYLTVENEKDQRWTVFRKDLKGIKENEIYPYLVPLDENHSDWAFAVVLKGDRAEENMIRRFDAGTFRP
ncbi:MAG: hypothetical protein ACOX0J_01390 [Thermoactinomyces vulgaris]|jgi:hypothetical protein|nr:hypothetical protein [Thermoactinomyces vulgaris]RMB02135.1 hypothetical protein ATH33_0945 [Thermoactinomyces vulgaris]